MTGPFLSLQRVWLASLEVVTVEVFVTEIKMESSKHCSFWSHSRNHDKFRTTGFVVHLLFCLAIFHVFLENSLCCISCSAIALNNSGIEQNMHHATASIWGCEHAYYQLLLRLLNYRVICVLRLVCTYNRTERLYVLQPASIIFHTVASCRVTK